MLRELKLATWLVGLVCCLGGFTAGVTTGQKMKLEGWIVNRQEQSITVRTTEAGEIAVLVTPYTKVHEPKGLFNIRKKQMPNAALLPGLRIKITGIGNTQGQVIAESISFSGDDLRTAHAIQSGTATVQNQVAVNTKRIASNEEHIEANRQQIARNQVNIRSTLHEVDYLNQRFSDLSQYVVKSTTLIYFSPGSSTLNPAGQDLLRRLAREAQSLSGYFIQIMGYADSSGAASLNQDLSMRRAQSVLGYLQSMGNIPLTNVLTPAAMGESGTVTSNQTPQGRSENRRVEVKILVNRGLAGQPVKSEEKISTSGVIRH